MPGTHEPLCRDGHAAQRICQIPDGCGSVAARPVTQRENFNFKRHSSGHLYFSLKDESSVDPLRDVPAERLWAELYPQGRSAGHADGLCFGCYTRDGQYQFYCEKMQADGVGALYQQFERNKARFAAEGAV